MRFSNERFSNEEEEHRFMRALRAHGPRVLISLYFFNNLAQGLQLWRSNNGAFPLVAAVVALPAAALAANAHARFAAAVCCAELAHASAAVVLDVGGTRWRSGVWFVDELMVKKFSLLGGGLMLLLQLHFGPGASGTRRTNSGGGGGDGPAAGSVGGLLGVGQRGWSVRQSAAIAAGRVLLGAVFLFAGYSELRRQLASVRREHGGGRGGGGGGGGRARRMRAPGDGHDQIWAKLSECLVALPLVAGWQTRRAAAALAALCVLEALVQWPWWLYYCGDPYRLGWYYAISAREHFVVNLSLAGGMALLRGFGAGRFSVDAMLRKED
jgi:alanyl-tRNA synthetase